MDDSIEGVRQDIAETRARLSDTLSELDNRVDHVKAAARKARDVVSPPAQAREHPWLMLGLALGAGIALGMSGADRRAVGALRSGARKAGPALRDGASHAALAVKSRFAHDEVGGESRPGATARVLDAFRDRLDQQVAEVTRAMVDAVSGFGRRHHGNGGAGLN